MSKIATIHPGQLATQKPWPNQGEINELARRLDNVARFEKRFEPITKDNVRWKLGELQQLIKDFECSGTKGMATMYAKNSPDLELAEWRDEDWNIQQSAVSKMLAVLVGSFPTSNLPDAPVFTRVMLDDVMALDPGFVELECACRKLRQSQKFMPSISEIVAAVKEEKHAWSMRFFALDCIEDSYNGAIALLDDELKRIEAAKAAEKATADRKAAKSQPIVVGDRVHNGNTGAGTVMSIKPPTTFEFAYYCVRFDVIYKGKNEHEIEAKYLERLIPGDEGYEPPAVPMIEHCKDVPMAPIDLPAVPLVTSGNDDTQIAIEALAAEQIAAYRRGSA